MSTLSGVNYTYVEMWLTDEEMSSIPSRSEGCSKCEGVTEINVEGSRISIKDDELMITNTYKFGNTVTGVQISYCPFCGKKL